MTMTLQELYKDKGFQRMVSPNAQMRRMYYNPPLSIGKDVDLTPHYNDDIKIGVVIGTYGSVPYVDLNLHCLKNINGITDILVHDDCSPQKDVLKTLCSEYNADFYSTPCNMPNIPTVGMLGDTSCFYEGLKWAKDRNLDILVKVSRRMIPCFDWKTRLIDLVKDSDGLTFSSYCEKDRFPIRTEMIAMNVNAWTNAYPMGMMKMYLDNEMYMFAEYWFHEIAKELDYQNFSERHFEYVKSHRTGYEHSGYIHWLDALGTNRYTDENRTGKVLWHQYSTNEEYLAEMQKAYGDKYSLEDLK